MIILLIFIKTGVSIVCCSNILSNNISSFKKITTPVASRIWKTGIYLPSSHTLSETNIKFIAEEIKKLKKK